MSETNKPKTQKEKRDERINKIFTVSKEMDTLINQSITDPETKEKLLSKNKELKALCYAQSRVIMLAYMIYFFKYLKPDKKAQYTKGLISNLNLIVNEDAVNESNES